MSQIPGFAAWPVLLIVLLVAGCTSNRRDSPAGAVAASTPEASQAGQEILQAGGNAVDAAVAVAFALAVTEPAGSGLGGQSSIILHPPDARPWVLNGTSFAPRQLPETIAGSDLKGRRLTTIPTTVKVMEFAWRNYGSGRITWKRLLQPAIRRAEAGFPVGVFRHLAFQKYQSLLAEDPAAATRFQPGGDPPRLNALFRNPPLARTLRRLAEHGAEDFYRGEIARQIDGDMRRNGGWLEAEDLAWLPDPPVVEPLHTTYRGWDVYSLPPPAGGWVVLQALNLMEQGPPEVHEDTPERWRHLAEALRIAFLQRRDAPVKDLADYQFEATARVGKEEAVKLSALIRDGSGETTHFSVVDGNGFAVGVTQSLNNYFGSGVLHPELGILYNDYMREFELEEPQHPYALRPGARPYSSMSATILAQSGQPRLVLGSPGSSRIISAVVQVVTRWVDLEQPIREAVKEPRIHVVPPDHLYLETGALLEQLEPAMQRLGYQVEIRRSGLSREALDPYFGGVHAVAREAGWWVSANDPRRDGQ